MSDPYDYFADAREEWRRIINAALAKDWPQYKLGRRDEFEMPDLDPKLAKAAVFQPASPRVNLADPTTWDARTAILNVIAVAAGKVIRARNATTAPNAAQPD